MRESSLSALMNFDNQLMWEVSCYNNFVIAKMKKSALIMKHCFEASTWILLAHLILLIKIEFTSKPGNLVVVLKHRPRINTNALFNLIEEKC